MRGVNPIVGPGGMSRGPGRVRNGRGTSARSPRPAPPCVMAEIAMDRGARAGQVVPERFQCRTNAVPYHTIHIAALYGCVCNVMSGIHTDFENYWFESFTK